MFVRLDGMRRAVRMEIGISQKHPVIRVREVGVRRYEEGDASPGLCSPCIAT